MRKTTAIRKEVGSIIETLAKFSVYTYTKNNLEDKDLPAVIVTTSTGAYEDGDENVLLDIRVEIRDKESKIEDVLDAHAEMIEPLLPIGDSLGGLVEYIKPESFDYLVDSETNVGTMGLNYNVKYET